MSPIRLLTLALWLAPSAAMAQVYESGEVILLDSAVPVGGMADHITIAINDEGDALATWGSSIDSVGGPNEIYSRVEAQFFRRTGKNQWTRGARVTLGECFLPNTGGIYALGEYCRKPDVVSVGRNFIVAWPRIENSILQTGQLEAAFVEVPVLPADAIYHTESPGFGYMIDSVNPYYAGVMPDLAFNHSGPTDQATVAYVHFQEARHTTGYGIVYDHDIRVANIDFSAGGPPSVTVPQTLATRVGFDLTPNGSGGNSAPESGGKVLPDCVFDKEGNLVLSFEEYRRQYAVSPPTGNDYGRIHIRRFAQSNGMFIPLNSMELFGLNPEYPQRRPNLFRTPSNDQISLAWGEKDPLTNAGDIFHYDLDFLSLPPSAVNRQVPHGPAVDEDIPIPFQYASLHGVIMSCMAIGVRILPYRIAGVPVWKKTKGLTPFKPWRATLDILEDDSAHGRPNRGWIALGFEGKDNGEARTFLVFHPL